MWYGRLVSSERPSVAVRHTGDVRAGQPTGPGGLEDLERIYVDLARLPEQCVWGQGESAHLRRPTRQSSLQPLLCALAPVLTSDPHPHPTLARTLRRYDCVALEGSVFNRGSFAALDECYVRLVNADTNQVRRSRDRRHQPGAPFS